MHTLPFNLIAQGGSLQTGLAALVWTAVVIVILVGAVLFLKAARRKLASPMRAPLVTSGSALEELRVLRDSGKLSQAEFESARAKLIARASARMAQDRASTGVAPVKAARGSSGRPPESQAGA